MRWNTCCTYRRRILSLLLLRPEERLHVREIARLTQTLAGSLHRELKLLAEAGLLVREKFGNQVCYHADRECVIFEDLAAIFRKTAGLELARLGMRQDSILRMHHYRYWPLIMGFPGERPSEGS